MFKENLREENWEEEKTFSRLTDKQTMRDYCGALMANLRALIHDYIAKLNRIEIGSHLEPELSVTENPLYLDRPILYCMYNSSTAVPFAEFDDAITVPVTLTSYT